MRSFRRVGAPLSCPLPETLSSGIVGFESQGFGGWPVGQISALDGPPGSGKTACALAAVGAAQRRGERVLYVDLEHGLSAALMLLIGVDLSLPVLRMTRPDEALEAALLALRRGALDLLVVDTLAAAHQPQRWLAQAVGLAARHRTTILVLDQQRQLGTSALRAASGLSLTHHATYHGRLRPGRHRSELRWLKKPAESGEKLNLNNPLWDERTPS
jgi:RecA/RadA recombinase